jgi:hypothetical protein
MMAKASEVLQMLCPGVEYITRGEKYEDIDWLGAPPAITKKQFTDGFAGFEAWKLQQEQDQSQAKSALLNKLGITADEAVLLLS